MALLLLTEPNNAECFGGILNTETGSFSDLNGLLLGRGRGTARKGNVLAVAIQTETPYETMIQMLSVESTGKNLPPFLSPLESFVMFNIDDIHDIVWCRDEIFVVSSANDRVFRMNLHSKKCDCIFRMHEEASDLYHLNSICRWKGGWWYSMFGLQQEGDWRKTKDGSVWPLKPKKLGIMTETREFPLNIAPLFHPHSLKVIQDHLVVCESQTGCLRDALTTATLIRVPGYIRGIAYSPENEIAYLGVSSFRNLSKHTGKIYVPEQEQLCICGVYEIDCESWQIIRFHPIPDGRMREIYAIEIL